MLRCHLGSTLIVMSHKKTSDYFYMIQMTFREQE
jgi:hypothetical protein